MRVTPEGIVKLEEEPLIYNETPALRVRFSVRITVPLIKHAGFLPGSQEASGAKDLHQALSKYSGEPGLAA
jgi:hypothetical protein